MVTVVTPLLDVEEDAALFRILDYLADEVHEYITLPPEERTKHIYSAVLTMRAAYPFSRPQFEIGKTVATPGADEALRRAKQPEYYFLRRHETGDWGEVGQEDWKRNDDALTDGTRIFSVYRTSLGERIWVITEADRSVTTILLPEEY